MFTGLVSDLGRLVSVKAKGKLKRLRVECRSPVRALAIGASIAVDGICLTIVAKGKKGKGSWFDVEVGSRQVNFRIVHCCLPPPAKNSRLEPCGKRKADSLRPVTATERSKW